MVAILCVVACTVNSATSEMCPIIGKIFCGLQEGLKRAEVKVYIQSISVWKLRWRWAVMAIRQCGNRVLRMRNIAILT